MLPHPFSIQGEIAKLFGIPLSNLLWLLLIAFASNSNTFHLLHKYKSIKSVLKSIEITMRFIFSLVLAIWEGNIQHFTSISLLPQTLYRMSMPPTTQLVFYFISHIFFWCAEKHFSLYFENESSCVMYACFTM